jgi:thiosulfate dehydrogenase
MTRVRIFFSLMILAGLALALSGRQSLPSPLAQSRSQMPAAASLNAVPPSSLPIAKTWASPSIAKIPRGALGESILLGLHIFQETPRYAAAYVGDKISCGDCHIQTGTMPYAMPLVGAPAWFPMHSDRADRMISLEDRIQECVTRSENGSPLPHDGPEMRGLQAFFDWLPVSQPSGQPNPGRGLASMPDLQGDSARGSAVYDKYCSACHGADGAGVPPILPPLWGPGAYNDGAGMNQVKKMAAFVARNMPQNKPGALTSQEAYDVSAYIASKPHPAYNHKNDIY